MNEGSQPVTRDELEKALERYVTKDEFAGFVQLMIDEQERSARRHDQLVEMIAATDQRLSATDQRIVASEQRLVEMIAATDQRIVASEQRLMVEIGRAARAAAEQRRREVGVLDDRYRDLPGRVAALERGLREHAEDAAVHGRPRRPKRTR